MSIVKSFSVGNGDMFTISHNSDNFSIIDCCLSEENAADIVSEITSQSADKGVVRFISTHPDEDHLRGLRQLDEHLSLTNFYCTRNSTTKEDESEDFKHYRKRRDDGHAFFLERGCSRRWMNVTNSDRGSAGLQVLWPIIDNEHYVAALEEAALGLSPNNISIALRYSIEDGATFLWLGDLETDFMEEIGDAIAWPETDIVFAAHHGRQSGRIPHAILDQLKPKIIVLGEAPSRNLHYYGNYHTITQNTAGDIIFDCDSGNVHIYVSELNYSKADFLDDEGLTNEHLNYIGTLKI